ncbi:MAG: hypothetical protein ACREQI_05060 [Candidatus Binataceae bacterium]
MAIAVLAVVGLAAFLVIRAQRLPDSVRPILWDHEVCAQCGMAIGDPQFACQLQTSEGNVYDFDDPGCLLTFLHRHRPHVRVIYFHSLHGGAWLKLPEVAFLRGQQTPMGYGLGAASPGTPNALDFAAAQNYVEARSIELRKHAEPLDRGAAQ